MLSALLLGILEGLTEFLPVSSTGHLIIADELLHFASTDKVFEIVIQMGAILAVVWLYRHKFWQVARDFFRDAGARKFVINILLAVLPALVLGALLHDIIKAQLFNVAVVACELIAGGIAILLIERFKRPPLIERTEQMGYGTALTIGLCQCAAMVPGVSRSGATIMGALLCRVGRPAAAEFSFFLAVPTMIAASVFDLYKSRHDLTGGSMELIGIGFVAAFFVALVVVRWLIRFVQTHGFEPFAWYRIAAGLAVIIFWLR